MLVLGIDTATWTGSVGLAAGGALLGHEEWRTDRSHVGALAERVRALLARHEIALADLRGLAVSIGPGSFTGLRIALAFAKGLAYAGDLPVAGVSTLEALAQAADAPVGAQVCAAVDARRREIYAAFFAVVSAGALRRLTDDAVWSPPALGAACDADTVVVGDAPAAHPDAFAAAAVRPFATHPPRGDVVARLGWMRLAAGQTEALGALEPHYVRAPDATPPAVPLRRG